MVFDTLDKLELYLPLVPQLQTIIEVMDKGDIYNAPAGPYHTRSPKVEYVIEQGETKTAPLSYVIHKKHTTVLIVLEGEELLSTSWREASKDAGPYNEQADVMMVESEPLSALKAAVGRFFVFFPGEPFRYGSPSGDKSTVKRVLFSLED